MGILDDAIRQHLDLKRQLGADENEVQKLEDEAFGPPSRPGEPDFPDRDDLTTGEQEAAPADSAELPEVGSAESEDPTSLMSADTGPPTVESPAAKPTTEEPQVSSGDAADEDPEADPDEPPTSSHEPDLSVVDQPTMLYDHTVDEDDEPASAEHPAPEAEPSVKAEATTGTAQASPPEDTVESPTARPEADEAPDDDVVGEDSDPLSESDDDGVFDLESLDLELDEVEAKLPPAVEPAAPAGEPEPPHQEEPLPPAPVDDEADPDEPQTSSFEPEPSTSEQRIADEPPPEEDDYEDVPEPGETPGGDVLDETPEFLRDQPEDDELWFEQGEPKDFDF